MINDPEAAEDCRRNDVVVEEDSDDAYALMVWMDPQ